MNSESITPLKLEKWPVSKGSMALAWGLARSVHFALQQRLLPVAERLATGEAAKNAPTSKQFRDLAEATYLLLKEDARNIELGFYPLSVLRPETPWEQSSRLIKIILDGLKLSSRRAKKQAKEFSSKVSTEIQELPEYYQRNFHFQTDGYLTSQSAELYDHQVEILFGGTGDPMRRMMIPRLKHELGDKPVKDMLEIGCGTGRLTHFMNLAFPKARITAIDPSEPYLQKAGKFLRKSGKVNLLRAFGEDLPFKDQRFDVVYSSFLFHELPREIRRAVLMESIRVLRPGGLLVALDSIQVGDDLRFDWALERFPIDFHEPFYKDYTQDPMENWAANLPGMTRVDHHKGLLSKVTLWKKAK